jgi:ABC-2 type transport system permease protein
LRPDIAFRFLVDRRRAELGWSLGFFGYTALMMALWPTIRESEGYQDAAADLPEAFDAFFGPGGIDLGSPGGYLNTYLFGMMLPLMLIVAGISSGASIVGGEEEDGTLELLLGHPLTRRRIVIEKVGAIVVYLLLFVVIAFVAIVALAPVVDMELSVGNVAAASLGTLLVGIVYGVAAVMIGAVSGRRGSAAGVAVGLAGLGYLLQVVAELATGWGGLRFLSPLYLANGTSPIDDGVPIGEFLGLLGISLVLIVAALVAFDRRDLRA